MKNKLSIVLTVVLTLTLLLTSGAFAGGGKNEVLPAQIVLDASLSEVSAVFDTPKADLEVARSREFNFEADTFLLSSIVDKESKQAYMVSTDAQGKVWIAKPKIEDELIDHMSQMKPKETVIVSIWAIYVSPKEELCQIPSKYPDVTFEGYRPALGADVSPEVLDAIEADVTEIKLKANEEAVQPVVDFLKSMGSTILYVSKYAPAVDAELSKGDVYELARMAEVESISLPNEPETFMNQASQNINADDVWQEGYDGGWSNDGRFPFHIQTYVAVVDDGIDFDHPALDHAYGGTFEDKTPHGDHGTEVAGCIASDDETYKGIAYGTRLLDANCYHSLPWSRWSETKQATDWALQANADVINLSSGFSKDGSWNNKYCKYFDHIAFEHDKLVVCSAGNERYTTDNCNVLTYVASPANAFNVLAVGGIDDQGDLNWSNDKIYWMHPDECPSAGQGSGCCIENHLGYSMEGSSARNPVDGREKPEVCAPAVGVTTTTPGGDFASPDGTSFAAPQVTGIAALLIEKEPSLQNDPKLLKAIIMATAIHNVVPNTIENDEYGHYHPMNPIDMYEGVGTVDAYAAYQCVEEGQYTWTGRSNDDPFYIAQFHVDAGQKVRFAINWLAHTDYHGSGDYELCADFNLTVHSPHPMIYYWSLSDTNSWEIVEFTATFTGTYKARVTVPRFDGDYESVAAAWYIW